MSEELKWENAAGSGWITSEDGVKVGCLPLEQILLDAQAEREAKEKIGSLNEQLDRLTYIERDLRLKFTAKDTEIAALKEQIAAEDKPWQEGLLAFVCAVGQIANECPQHWHDKHVRCSSCDDRAWRAYCEAVRFHREHMPIEPQRNIAIAPDSSKPPEPSEKPRCGGCTAWHSIGECLRLPVAEVKAADCWCCDGFRSKNRCQG